MIRAKIRRKSSPYLLFSLSHHLFLTNKNLPPRLGREGVLAVPPKFSLMVGSLAGQMVSGRNNLPGNVGMTAQTTSSYPVPRFSCYQRLDNGETGKLENMFHLSGSRGNFDLVSVERRLSFPAHLCQLLPTYFSRSVPLDRLAY